MTVFSMTISVFAAFLKFEFRVKRKIIALKAFMWLRGNMLTFGNLKRYEIRHDL